MEERISQNAQLTDSNGAILTNTQSLFSVFEILNIIFLLYLWKKRSKNDKIVNSDVPSGNLYFSIRSNTEFQLFASRCQLHRCMQPPTWIAMQYVEGRRVGSVVWWIQNHKFNMKLYAFLAVRKKQTIKFRFVYCLCQSKDHLWMSF